MPHSTRALATRWFEEVWNQRRAETIDELSAPNCVGHMEGNDGCCIADFKEMRTQLMGAIPNIKLIIEDVLADEHAAVVRWTAVGETSASKPVSFSGMSWLKFTDGRITEAWDRWNRDGLMRQLGVS